VFRAFVHNYTMSSLPSAHRKSGLGVAVGLVQESATGGVRVRADRDVAPVPAARPDADSRRLTASLPSFPSVQIAFAPGRTILRIRSTSTNSRKLNKSASGTFSRFRSLSHCALCIGKTSWTALGSRRRPAPKINARMPWNRRQGSKRRTE